MPNTNEFVEFSKPFIEACRNIFSTMLFAEIKTQKPSIKDHTTPLGDISAMIGLSGELARANQSVPYNAMLVLSFPYETYFKMASAMLGETYTSYSPEIHDLGGEIVNMIMGNSKRDLKELGYTSNMAIPSTVEGKGHKISYPQGTTVVVIPLESEHGRFVMELCYKTFE